MKYKQLRRNEPMNPNQIYSDKLNDAEIAERQLRKIERWKRHLSRYARFYERTRLPTDPEANEIFRTP